MENSNGDIFEIRGVETSVIIKIAEKIVKATINIPGNKEPGKKGGYLDITMGNTGTILLFERIGKCPVNKIHMVCELAQEKSTRLRTRIHEGHKSSYQSRNPKIGKFGQWGGAVLIGKYDIIISFSGLTEIMDEAVSLVLALALEWITIHEALEIAKISGNTFVEPLYSAISK